jgi:MFS family permease
MFPALKHRNYKIYLSGQMISLVGTWMQQLAMSWMVYRLTNSAFWLGFAGFSSQIPMFFFGLFAGVIVDHVDRHKLLLWTQSLSALQAFTLAFLTLTNRINLTELIVLNFSLGLINCFDITGRQSFVIQMVKDKNDLPNAIALNSSVVNLTRLIGPAIAGAAIATLGEGVCFLLNGASYLAVLIALFSIKVEKVKPLHFDIKKIFKTMEEGYHATFSNESMRAIIIFAAIISFFGSPFINILPAVAAKLPNGGAKTLGWISAATGFGSLIAALFLALRNGPPKLAGVIGMGGILMGVFLISLSQSHSLPFVIFSVFFSGMGLMLQLSASNAVIQILVRDDLRGRVFSFFTLAMFGAGPFGSLLMGYTGEHFGLNYTFMVSGLMCIVGSFYFYKKVKTINQALQHHLAK